MKSVIVRVNDDGWLVDINGVSVGVMVDQFKFKEHVENNQDVDVVKLVGLGVSPDDLIKMKTSGVL